MSSLNKVIILGNLGKDPEIRTTQSGKIVANFSVATSEKYKDSAGEKIEKTEWHNVVLWGKLAELAEKYIKKGSKVLIEGKLQTRSWETDGGKRYTTEIIGSNMVFVGGGGQQERCEQDANNVDPGDQGPNPEDDDQSDLPF